MEERIKIPLQCCICLLSREKVNPQCNYTVCRGDNCPQDTLNNETKDAVRKLSHKKWVFVWRTTK